MPLQENQERKRRAVAKRLARPRLEKPQAFLKAEGRRAAKTPVGTNSLQRRSQTSILARFTSSIGDRR